MVDRVNKKCECCRTLDASVLKRYLNLSYPAHHHVVVRICETCWNDMDRRNVFRETATICYLINKQRWEDWLS
jgi:hypothetical protein